MTQNQIHGAFWKVLACLCFAGMNGLIKILSVRLPSPVIAFFEHSFGVLWLVPFVIGEKKKIWHTRRLDLQLWRVLLACVGVLLFYQAISVIPLSQAVALSFTGPLVTILGARIFLGERLTTARLGAIGFGLLGGLLIINARYLTQEIPWGSQGWEVLFPFGSAAAFSICNLLNKKLTHYDSPLTIVTYLMVCMVPFLGVLAWPSMVWPSGGDWGLLIGLGCLNMGAYFSLSRSFVCTDVLFLLPFGSVKLIASALIGFFFFAQSFNTFVLLGFLVIFAGVFMVVRFEKA